MAADRPAAEKGKTLGTKPAVPAPAALSGHHLVRALAKGNSSISLPMRLLHEVITFLDTEAFIGW